jgi:hypothetical protein
VVLAERPYRKKRYPLVFESSHREPIVGSPNAPNHPRDKSYIISIAQSLRKLSFVSEYQRRSFALLNHYAHPVQVCAYRIPLTAAVARRDLDRKCTIARIFDLQQFSENCRTCLENSRAFTQIDSPASVRAFRHHRARARMGRLRKLSESLKAATFQSHSRQPSQTSHAFTHDDSSGTINELPPKNTSAFQREMSSGSIPQTMPLRDSPSGTRPSSVLLTPQSMDNRQDTSIEELVPVFRHVGPDQERSMVLTHPQLSVQPCEQAIPRRYLYLSYHCAGSDDSQATS